MNRQKDKNDKKEFNIVLFCFRQGVHHQAAKGTSGVPDWDLGASGAFQSECNKEVP